MTSRTLTEKRSWIEVKCLFLLCNKSSAQKRFIHLLSVTVFTALYSLYKRCRISLKSYQRCNSAFIYMFSIVQMAVHLFVFLTRWEWNETVWTRSRVCCLSPLFPLRSAAHHVHFFSVFFKTVVRINQFWNRGFRDPLMHSLWQPRNHTEKWADATIGGSVCIVLYATFFFFAKILEAM